MSEDLIKKSDAIKAIANLHILADEEKIFRVYADNPHSMTTDFEGTLIDAINAIKSIPSADRPQGEWVPCSERLPEEDGLYLATVTDDGERFETAKMVYVGSEWIDTGFWEYEVIAWMPLPKPWKGADDDC